MRRREFIVALAGAATFPLVTQAQQVHVPRIGVLIPANPEPFWSAFREGLKEHGYIDGQNVRFEFRTADGNPALLPVMADELVRLGVDIIVASQTPAVQAAKDATVDIPIVMATAGDPVGTGLIASLARPGRNITGLSGTTVETGGKMLELIREMLPSTKRVAVLANAIDPFTKPFVAQIELAGSALGLAIQTSMVRSAEEFEIAFANMSKAGAQAVIIQPSLPRKRALDLSLVHRLLPVSPTRLFPEEGGLMSYSGNQNDQYRRAAVFIDRILKGAKPADLPVELPTKFELVINLKTAKALGLSVPATLLARADEVIE